MADSGFVGAYGNVGLQDAIQTIRDRAVKQAQQQFENQQALAASNRSDRALNQNDELTRLKIQELADAKAGTERDKQFTEGVSLDNTIPGGTVVPMTSPIAGRLQMVGALQHQDATLPSTPAPGMASGTPGGAPMIKGTLRAMPQPGNPEQFVKLASEKQQQDAQTNAKNDAAIARQQAALDEATRHNQAMENKQPAPALVVMPTVDDQGNPVNKIVPKTAGASYKVKPGATVENRLSTAQAVTQTGNDIVAELADPTFRNTVGPAMGRYNTLRDFIGNPPPEFAQLAGQIESYALANMGVHGMRSAQGAAMISQLLDKKHTPESMAAAIKGLNDFAQHYMENNGRGGGSPSAAPAASAGSAVPANVAAALKSAAPGKHTLSDGSVWLTDASGAITKQ